MNIMGCGCSGGGKKRRQRSFRPSTKKLISSRAKNARNTNEDLNANARSIFSGATTSAKNRQRKRIEKLRRDIIRSKFGK